MPKNDLPEMLSDTVKHFRAEAARKTEGRLREEAGAEESRRAAEAQPKDNLEFALRRTLEHFTKRQP